MLWRLHPHHRPKPEDAGLKAANRSLWHDHAGKVFAARFISAQIISVLLNFIQANFIMNPILGSYEKWSMLSDTRMFSLPFSGTFPMP